MKSTYSAAGAVIGVAPYVRELPAPCAPPRFEIMAETGIEKLAPEPKSAPAAGETLRLLFVGRIIRTKGILDGIRALGRCAERVDAHLDVVGTGELLDECEAEAATRTLAAGMMTPLATHLIAPATGLEFE